jgi:hypothetical protein
MILIVNNFGDYFYEKPRCVNFQKHQCWKEYLGGCLPFTFELKTMMLT